MRFFTLYKQENYDEPTSRLVLWNKTTADLRLEYARAKVPPGVRVVHWLVETNPNPEIPDEPETQQDRDYNEVLLQMISRVNLKESFNE